MSQLKAVIFGAIGTIAETSDIQRQAFNEAFKAANLPWTWTTDTYRDLLKVNGGQNRLRAYRNADLSRASVTDAMIEQLHTAKTNYYVKLLHQGHLHPRLGVVELINACQAANLQVAFCTSTSAANVKALEVALANELPFKQFSTIVTIEQIAQPKPAPDAYRYCLQQLGLDADQVIAIEDTPASLVAAQAVGIKTIATPGALTVDQDFSAADWVMSDLQGVTVARLSAWLAQPARQSAAVSQSAIVA
jgi:HAD superfamily hydrolase (TIGR01509 family)